MFQKGFIELRVEFLPYFSPSKFAKRLDASISVIEISIISPNSLPFFVPTSTVLKSESEILQAEKDGKITLTSVDVVINMPQIKWPDDQMKVREDKNLTD